MMVGSTPTFSPILNGPFDLRCDTPRAASQEGVLSGIVVVRCEVGDGGRPTGCEAVSETPTDLGFRLAAVEGIQTGVLDAKWVKDWPEGVKFAVRVQFVLGD